MTDIQEQQAEESGSVADEAAGRAVNHRSVSLRSAPVEVSHKGRTVEAYAAVFNRPVSVADQDGRYKESLDPTCFNRALEHHRRSGRQIPVLLNHGMTIFQTPSEQDGLPIGVTEEIHADSKGLYTRAKFHDTPRANHVLECIQDGSIRSYSFSGMFKRSDPVVPRGGFRPLADGSLRTVHRTESTLREYGPATFPVYEDAEIFGVRAEQIYGALLGQLPPDEVERLVGMFRSGVALDEEEMSELGTPDEGPAISADDPPVGHSERSIKEEIQAARAEFAERLEIRKQIQARNARFIVAHGTTPKD
jgi:HK97 family phage prohead protease